MLPAALESILSQNAGGLTYDVVIVDNNSNDATRQVVESFAEKHSNLRYVFEGRQGLSYGRNTGIENTRAPIIAFTDDDVGADPNWIANIKRHFDEEPDIDFIGGKVLPRWKSPPPAWLTREVWAGPLALVDAGDKPFYSTADAVYLFPGANFSFRRSVFERVGMFDPNFQRVTGWVSSVEDSEFLLRLLRAGGRGLYAPDVVVEADVQTERVTKEYLRKWYSSRGRYRALLRYQDIIGPRGELREPDATELRLFGSPASLYRALFAETAGYLKAKLLLRENEALRHEFEVRQSRGYLSERYRRTRKESTRAPALELTSFAYALLRKKLS
jgi:glycosyltransferase involved in cell wall biosynthesis